jgi:DNA-binding response OmpR family regulator
MEPPTPETTDGARCPDHADAVVLVVDDDWLDRELSERFLVGRGYRVIAIDRGHEVVETIAEERVDLVLLDVLIPDVDGFEVLRAIRERYSMTELPVVVATGLDSTDDVVVRALRGGANDYVTKPIDFRLVAARLESQLALKKATDCVKELDRRLADTTERLLRLVGSTSTALADVASWATAVAADIALALGVLDVGAWSLENDQVRALNDTSTSPPRLVDLAMILHGSTLDREGDTVLPVLGYTDDLVGALVVPGGAAAWAPGGRPFVEAFARQLGGVLEMRRTLRQLDGREEDRVDESAEDLSLLTGLGGDYVQVCHLCGRCYEASADGCAACGPGALLHQPVPIPARLADRYRLVRVLGKGGMGAVFAADDQRLGRDVAIKVISPEYAGRKTVRARFKQEAQVIASIHHEGVVNVYDVGETDNGAFFIVMERLYGLDLEILVKTCGPGTTSEVLSFVRQAAAAIDAAHRAMVIHRDVKPGNFFLVPRHKSFRVKTLDFGLAQRASVRATLTKAGTIVGTPLYMSPEQAMGRTLDHRTDIYSLAAVTYRALTGRPPSSNTSYSKILEDVVRHPPPRVSAFLPSVPRRVDKAFAWALAKRPEDRPGSATEWVRSFYDALEPVPSQALGWLRPEGLGGAELSGEPPHGSGER